MTSKQSKRVHAAQYLLMQGVNYTQVAETISVQYGVSERQGKRDIAIAKAQFRLDDESLKSQTEIDLALIQYLKQQALQKGSFETALRCVKIQIELREEHRATQTKSTHHDTEPTLPDALVQALQRLDE